ncbi:MAG: SLATT domain-containing protein [Actinobacteria bacterium]|nr:SLATT domain-containing protein [Actinomycetota bacterium]
MASTPTLRARDVAPRFVWDDALEDLYGSWHRRVAAAERGHRLMADRLRRRHLLIGIPVVVLTTLVGTSAFASLNNARSDSITTRGIDSDVVLVIVGTLSVLAAVLSSLQTFLRYATRAEAHRIAALRYETLRREMAKKLTIPREARGDPDRDLDQARLRMDRYAKESPNIGEREWQKLTAEFHLSTVPPDPHWHGEAVVIPDGTREEVGDRR